MGKFTGNPLYLMVKTMVSCRFSLNPIQWGIMKVEVTFVIQKWNWHVTFLGWSNDGCLTGAMMSPSQHDLVSILGRQIDVVIVWSGCRCHDGNHIRVRFTAWVCPEMELLAISIGKWWGTMRCTWQGTLTFRQANPFIVRNDVMRGWGGCIFFQLNMICWYDFPRRVVSESVITEGMYSLYIIIYIYTYKLLYIAHMIVYIYIYTYISSRYHCLTVVFIIYSHGICSS